MRKAISIVLIFLLVFSLVGCKSHGNGTETAYPKQEETPSESGEFTDIETVESENITDTNSTVTDNQQSEEQSTPETEPDENPNNDEDQKQTEENKVNQVELENQPHIEDHSSELNYTFFSVEEMIESIKSGEYDGFIDESDIDYWNRLQKHHLENGGKGHAGHNKLFDTYKITHLYKIKDVPGYKLEKITLNSKIIRYAYIPEDNATNSEEVFNVTYYRPEDFVTDSYFEDYIEYYKIGKEKLLDDKYIYKNYEKHGFSVILFAVENTVINISGRNEFISYEALKELCVPEKVVVK